MALVRLLIAVRTNSLLQLHVETASRGTNGRTATGQRGRTSAPVCRCFRPESQKICYRAGESPAPPGLHRAHRHPTAFSPDPAGNAKSTGTFSPQPPGASPGKPTDSPVTNRAGVPRGT